MSSASSELLAEVDSLVDQGKNQEVYDKLKRADGNYDDMELDLMWRLARSIRFLVLTKGVTEKKEKPVWIAEGLKVTEAAIKKYPNECLSNTWHGVMLNVRSQEEGIRKKIELGYEIRKFFDKGYEANPKEYITLHCLGSWCYEVASLGRLDRLFASTFFATPPEASFDEALKFYLEANEAEPNHAYTVCRIALCYNKLGKKEEAKTWAKKATKLEVKDSEMEEAMKECRRLTN